MLFQTTLPKTVAGCEIQWISRFGVPGRFHSDRGPELMGQIFQELCQLFQLKKTSTSGYAPWSNAIIEGSNRTLKSMLLHFTDSGKGDWDEYIPLLAGASRATQHASTGFSPNQMVLGVELIQPVDLVYGIYTVERLDISPHVFIQQLHERLKAVWACARIYLGQAAEVQQAQFNKGVPLDKCHVYKTGDKVMKFHPPLHHKLGAVYKGPLTVVKVIDQWLVEVRDGRRVYMCNTRNLKPYVPLEEANSQSMAEQLALLMQSCITP